MAMQVPAMTLLEIRAKVRAAKLALGLAKAEEA
jgi:hypothetical protein